MPLFYSSFETGWEARLFPKNILIGRMNRFCVPTSPLIKPVLLISPLYTIV
ncbi:TPA: hypothetical protein TY278_000239 [Streptococcus suis]|nr:hypothetical protein [Streptococcus suis]HEL1997840.1 hypothetical protein [Streptococcus suis]